MAKERKTGPCATCRFKVEKPKPIIFSDEELKKPGVEQAWQRWQADQKALRQKEKHQVEQLKACGDQFAFDYEPFFYEWCALYTKNWETHKIFSGVRGEIGHRYFVCEVRNNPPKSPCYYYEDRLTGPKRLVFWKDEALADAEAYLRQNPQLLQSNSGPPPNTKGNPDRPEFEI